MCRLEMTDEELEAEETTARHIMQDWLTDRRVPLALFIAIIMQTATALLWAGAAGQRLTHLEGQAITARELVERTARLEAQMSNATRALDRIEWKIGNAQGASSPAGREGRE
jgi:cell division protein FtsL